MTNLGMAKPSADPAIGRSSNLSPAVEDYLRALYKLGRRNPAGEPVTTSQVATCLNVRPATILKSVASTLTQCASTQLLKISI